MLGVDLLRMLPFRSETEDDRRLGYLNDKLHNAQSYQEWLDIATQIDNILGNDKWKQDESSVLYDYQLTKAYTEELQAAMDRRDYQKLLFLIRTKLQRNLGNMGDSRLYHCSLTGTKKLIEDYISACERAIEMVTEAPNLDKAYTLSILVQSRRAFGRTALLLSGGSVFGSLHVGVLNELFDARLLPKVISGSSAGSIFASVVCIHTDEELAEQLSLIRNQFDFFEETGNEEKFIVRLTRFLKEGTWFDNKYLSATLRDLLGDLTFQEAYYRTGRILNVTVSAEGMHEMPKLLNYLTAPNVLIWSAVCASCSLPLVFASYDIMAKDPVTGKHTPWAPASFIDGSVYSDLPLTRLSEMFNVNHFIVCQVNPHIAPLVQLSENLLSAAWRREKPNTPTSSRDANIEEPTKSFWANSRVALENGLYKMQTLAVNEASHFFNMLTEFGIFSNASSKVQSLFNQDYSGDITILPKIRLRETAKMFKNPSPEFLMDTKHRGSKATWPCIAMIRNHCAIENALERSIHTTRSMLLSTGPRNKNLAVSAMPRRSESGIIREREGRTTSPSSPSNERVESDRVTMKANKSMVYLNSYSHQQLSPKAPLHIRQNSERILMRRHSWQQANRRLTPSASGPSRGNFHFADSSSRELFKDSFTKETT